MGSKPKGSEAIATLEPLEHGPMAEEGASGKATVLEARKQPDPLIEFSGRVKENLRRFLQLAAKIVRYVDYWEYFDEEGERHTLAVEEYVHIVNLAALDLFTVMSERDKIRYLRGNDVETLATIRSHPSFRAVSDDIAAKINALRDGRGLDVLAPFFESEAAFATAHTMFFGRKDRDVLAAAAEFMDRVAPKKSRGEGGNTLVVVLPPGQEDVMRRTAEIMSTVHTDPVISAKVVRVPLQIEE